MITWLINSRFTQWLLMGLAVVMGALAALRQAERRGKQDAIQEGIADASERVEKGRGAVADGRERGSADNRVQHNDAAW